MGGVARTQRRNMTERGVAARNEEGHVLLLTSSALIPTPANDPVVAQAYRRTLLVRKRPTLGPYRSLCLESLRERFLMSEAPLCPFEGWPK